MPLLEKDDGKLLAKWLTRRNILFLHVPNEGVRSVMEASSLIAQGLQPGAPDYLIFTPPETGECGVAIELKKVGWKPRNAKDKMRLALQHAFLASLEDAGWTTKICYGWEDAVKFLEGLGY